MIRVTYGPMVVGFDRVYTFSDELVPKVLQSGVLKIVRLVEVDIPMLPEEWEGGGGIEGKDIVKQPEEVVAVFNGEYIMERVDED